LAGLSVIDAVTAICCFTAVIVTGVAAATPRVVTVNVADVVPAGTVTEDGTIAAAMFELERKTGTPPTGAAAEIVTVPVALLPPTMVTGFSERDVGSGPLVAREACAEETPRVAVMVVATSLPTATVDAVNVAVEDVAGTVTEAGTVTTDVSEEERVTATPPVGAGPLIVTVPVDACPPATAVGLNEIDRTIGAAVRASAALFVAPPYAAEIVTEERVPVVRVVTGNVAVLAPAATRTFAGTIAFAGLELVSVTVAPPVGAGPFNVTVAVGASPRGTLNRSSVVENAWIEGTTVKIAVFEVPPDAAVIVTIVFVATANVVTAKVVDEAPAGTVAVAGTVAAAVFELVNVTTVPPGAPRPFIAIMAIDVEVPKAAYGARVKESGIGTAEVVSEALRLKPAFVAVIVVDPVVVVGSVGIANV
jgi:hypothetical protein